MRVLIVIVVFLAGVFVGNIYMPKKLLESSDITALSAPQTSLNLTREPNLESTLKAVAQTEAALSNTGMDPELIFSWSDMMQRTLVLQAYRAARAEYDLELIRVQNNPANRDQFLKAQSNYMRVKAALEAAFPATKEEPAELLTTGGNNESNSIGK